MPWCLLDEPPLRPIEDGQWAANPRRGTKTSTGERRGYARDGISVGRYPAPDDVADPNDKSSKKFFGGGPELPAVILCPDCRRDVHVSSPGDAGFDDRTT